MIETCITDPIYLGVLNIYGNVTRDQFVAEIKRRFPDLPEDETEIAPTSEAVFKVVYTGIGAYYFIWLKNFTEEIESLSTLNHEIFHFVTQLFRDRGIGFSDKSEENWAYTIGYYFTEAARGLVKDKRAKTKRTKKRKAK